MTDLIKRDDDLLWPSAYVGTPEQLLNCVTEMWRREKRVTVSAVLHAVIETLRAPPVADSQPADPALQARIEALVKERDEAEKNETLCSDMAVRYFERAEAAEAKLAKAVEALRWYDNGFISPKGREVLAELEGE